MKRPLPFVLLFFVFGILLRVFDLEPVFFYILIAACVGLCVALSVAYKQLFAFVLLLAVAVGFFRISQSLNVKSIEIDGFLDEPVTVVGKISEIYPNNQFDLKTESFTYNEEIIEKVLKIRVNLKEKKDLRVGDELKVYGTLEALSGQKNPGGYNEFVYLRARKIQYKLYGSVLETYAYKPSLLEQIRSGRNYLADTFDKALPQQEAGIIKSMILGDKSDLDEETKNLYRESGIYHILVISGLHISILFLSLSRLSYFLRAKLRVLVALSAIIFYTFLTGASVPVVRALIVCAVFIAAQLFEYEEDPINSAAIAAIVLLLYEPLNLLDIGFQYSFTAVFGILLLSKPIEQCLNALGNHRFFRFLSHTFHLKNKLTDKLTDKNGTNHFTKYISPIIAASLSTSLITGYYFYYILPYSIFANAIILPTVSIILLVSAVAGLVGLISTSVMSFLLGIVYYLLRFYTIVCTFFQNLPYAKIITGRWSLLSIGFFLLLVALFAYAFQSFEQQRKIALRFFYGVLGLYFLTNLTLALLPKPVRVAMLDVSQGDCFVITQGQSCYVIDGGGWFNTPEGQNTGTKVLLPYLHFLGIRDVEGLFISHEDSDHATGALEILGKIKIKNIFTTPYINKASHIYRQLEVFSKEKQVPIHFLSTGDEIQENNSPFLAKNIKKDMLMLTCLYPLAPSNTESFPGSFNSDENDTSLVLLLSYGDTDFCFTGDIGAQAERDLLENKQIPASLREKLQSVEVLKLAHHGSNYSNSEAFLNYLDPEFSLVSAGKNNIYKHPGRYTLERLKEQEIPLLSTIDLGAVLLETDGSRIKIMNLKKSIRPLGSEMEKIIQK